MLSEETKERRLLYYIGQRENSKRSVVHAFVEAPERINLHFHYWRKARAAAFNGAIIGKQYDMTKGLPVIWKDVETGEKVREDLAEEWQVISRSEVARKTQKKIDPAPELSGAVEVINQALLSQGRNHRMAFIAWLLNQLSY